MLWLAHEIWLWMSLAALAGAVLTGFFSTKEIKVERWVPSPVPVDSGADIATEGATEGATGVAAPASSPADAEEEHAGPFPDLAPLSASTSGAWEDDLWSRPAGSEPELTAVPVHELQPAPDPFPVRRSGQPAAPEVEAEVEAELEAQVEAEVEAEVEPGVEAVPELSAAEKIRAELARLEAEVAKREARRRELEEEERKLTGPLDGADGTDGADEAADEADDADGADGAEEAGAAAESERLEAERLEAERLEAQRAERARARAKRAAATRARKKAERLAAEREASEAQRLEAQRLETERAAAKKAETPEPVEQVRLELVRNDEVEPVALGAWVAPSEDSDDWKHGPFGAGSAHPVFDGSAPKGFAIKGNVATKLYHSPRSRFYSRTQADVWFETEAHAEAAGFTRWDKRGSAAHLDHVPGAAQG